jgi:hypothetical protein
VFIRYWEKIYGSKKLCAHPVLKEKTCAIPVLGTNLCSSGTKVIWYW